MKDRLTLLFGVLNLLQGCVIGTVPLLLPSREPAFNWLLGAAAVAMLIAGPAIVFGGRAGRMLAAISCLYNFLLGAVLALLVVLSASYLYGIYGRHGHASAAIALVIAALGLVVFWLLPAHELHFLRRKAAEK